MVQGRRNSKETEKKVTAIWVTEMHLVCLLKAVFETRMEKKNTQRRAAGKLRAQRETLKVFFTLARWAAG